MLVFNVKQKPSNYEKKWVWGGSVDPFRKGLGRSGSSFGRFWVSWPLLGRSKSIFFPAWVQDGLQKGLGIDLGSILEGFGKDLGGCWGSFGRSWALPVGKNLVGTAICRFLDKRLLEISAKLLWFWDPRVASPTRLASQCAGVSDPSACWKLFPRSPHGDLRSEAPSGWASRIPPRIGWKTVLERQIGFFFASVAFFCNFSAFLAHLRSSWHFLSIFLDFA